MPRIIIANRSSGVKIFSFFFADQFYLTRTESEKKQEKNLERFVLSKPKPD